jgi:hypothetical protein
MQKNYKKEFFRTRVHSYIAFALSAAKWVRRGIDYAIFSLMKYPATLKMMINRRSAEI